MAPLRYAAYSAFVIMLSVGAGPAFAEGLVVDGRGVIGPENTAIGTCATDLPVICSYDNTTLNINGSYGAGTVDITGDDDPSVSVTATTSGGAQTATASGDLSYEIQLIPRGSPYPPILIDGLEFTGTIGYTDPTTDANGDSKAGNASVRITDPYGKDVYLNDQVGHFVLPYFTVEAYWRYTVAMSASASAASLGNGEAASAFVDPFFTLAPQYADLFTIEYSPGLLSVPEPSSWLMFLVGVGGLGTELRRRRNALTALRTA